MEILSVNQLKQVDQYTVETQNCTDWELMERASSRLFDAIFSHFPIAERHFTILCGTGNNGGDGLALARMLYHAGSDVKVYLKESDSYSDSNYINQSKLHYQKIQRFDYETSLEIPSESILIDALFGYGLNRPLSQEWTNIVAQINETSNMVLAIDMPSGLLADEFTSKENPIVKAEMVYTFHSPKLALMFPENAEFVGDFKVLDIDLATNISSNNVFVQEIMIRSWIKKPNRFSHKGTFGHALLIGGSYGSIGAVILSAKSVLKTGCGLVTTYTPACGYSIIQSAFPEAMVKTDSAMENIHTFPSDISQFSALGIGIGLGTKPETIKALTEFLQQKPTMPMVLDADALNIMAQNPALLKYLPKKTILTPHPKELERLIGIWKNDFEKLEKAKTFAETYAIILVIKGANTVIILPNGTTYFNSTGNYGMATGGSGDVLTGIITSLLAQKYPPEQASVMGVYLHGLAGDLASKHTYPKSMIASDIINLLSEAWFAVW